MELRHLRSFKVVAEELNFSRAARKLHVAQSALSRTIADLEAEMEVRLLDRSTHAVELTEAGVLFLDRVRRIVDDTRDAVTQAQRRSRGETGTLRIGFIATLSQSLLPRLVQSYRASFPSVELVLHELGPTQQREKILSGLLDCGFIGIGAQRPETELEMVVADEDDLMAAVPDKHPLASHTSIRLADLRGETFYLTSRSNAPVFNPWLIGLCEQAGFDPRIACESERSATVLNYVAAGFGVSLFPCRLATPPTSGVRFLRLAGRIPKYRQHLAWLGENRSPSLLEFLKLVQQQRRTNLSKSPKKCLPRFA